MAGTGQARQPELGARTAERVAPDAWGEISDWDEAVAESATPSVFLTRDWIAAWWTSFGDGLEPCLLRIAADGRTLGIAPFYLERLRLPATRLGLIGDRAVGSEYLGLIARRGHESEVARFAVDWLAASGSSWQLAELSGLREGDPAAKELELALGAATARAHTDRHQCSAIELPGDFEEYLAGLRSKFRQGYRQRTNKLMRTCEVGFVQTSSQEDLPGHLETFFRLHQGRWTEAGRLGAFADPRMRSFYDDVSRRLLRSGALRFWHLEVDGAIRASQFAFAYDGVLHSLQEAYDSDFSRPGIGGLGVVLRGHVLRAAIEEGLRGYDFLGGVEDHKLRWGASVHTVRELTLARAGPLGRAAWLTTVGAERTRDRLRAVLPERALESLRSARAGLQRRRRRPG